MAEYEDLNEAEEAPEERKLSELGAKFAYYSQHARDFAQPAHTWRNNSQYNDVINFAPTNDKLMYDTERTDEYGNPIMGNRINDYYMPTAAQQAQGPLPAQPTNSLMDNVAGFVQGLRQQQDEPGFLDRPVLETLAGLPRGIHDFAKENASDNFKTSKLYADLFYGADEKREALAKAQKLYEQGLIGVNPDALGIKQDRAVWENMMKQVQLVEKLEKIGEVMPDAINKDGQVDMRKVLSAFPEVKDILEKHGTNAAVMALHEIKGLKKVHDAYDNEVSRFFGSVAIGAERGYNNLKKQMVTGKAMIGATLGMRNEGLTKEERAYLKSIDKENEALASYSYDTVGAGFGGIIGSAFENAPMIITSQAARAAVATGVTAAGIASAPVAAVIGAAASVGIMALEIGGSQYEQNVNKVDNDGHLMYTPQQAGLISLLQGTSEGILEQYALSQIGTAITVRTAVRELAELYSGNAARTLALTAGRGMTDAELQTATRALVGQTLKEMAEAGVVSFRSELFEEFEQQVSDMVIENMAQIALKGEKAELSSVQDILGQSIIAAAEAVPAVAGFGFMGMAGHVGAHRTQLFKSQEYIKGLQSELAQNALHNQDLMEKIEAVGGNLESIKELQNKSPQLVEEILDSNNERSGIKDTMVDIKTLKQEAGGEAVVQEIAQKAGISSEELKACEDGTGMLSVKTSVLMQISSTAEEASKKALFRNITKNSLMETTAQQEQKIKWIKEAMEALKGKPQIGAEEAAQRYVKDLFTGEGAEAKTALVMDILRADINRPGAEIKKRLKDIQAEIDAELGTTIEQLQNGMKQGVDVVLDYEGKGARASNNAQWYRNFYEDNGRAPTKAELEQIAYDNATGQATRYNDGVVHDGSPEAMEYFNGVKTKLDALMAQRDALREVLPALQDIQPGDIQATARFSQEGRAIYHQLIGQLVEGNKKVQNAARQNAYIAVSLAEMLAKAEREAGGTDVKVADFVPGLVANAEENGLGLSQAEYNAQVEAVRQQYEGTDKWMKAPNGQQTNLTERQWLQVRTPAFKAWFGDWENDTENASKVVDENGEPLVVYHGTTKAEFDTFKSGFFVNDKVVAEWYAGTDKIAKPKDKYLDVGINKKDISDVLSFMDEEMGETYRRATDEEIVNYLSKSLREGYSKDVYKDMAEAIKSVNYDELSDVQKKLHDLAKEDYQHIVKMIDGSATIEDIQALFDNENKKIEISQEDDNDFKNLNFIRRKLHDNSFALGQAKNSMELYISESDKHLRDEDELRDRVRMYVTDHAEHGIYPTFINIKNPLVVDAKGDGWRSIVVKDKDGNVVSHGSTDKAAEYAKSAGYDGIVIKRVNDMSVNDYHPADDYVPFNSNQIKSATDNNGNFSLTDDNIYYQAQDKVYSLYDILPEEEQKKLQEAGEALAAKLDSLKQKQKDGTYNAGEEITICEVPDLYKELGYVGGKFVINADTLMEISKPIDYNGGQKIKNHHPHGMNKNILRQLPMALCNPLCVMDNINHSPKIAIIVDIDMETLNTNNQQKYPAKVFLSVEMDKKSQYRGKGGTPIYVNFVVTMINRDIRGIVNDISAGLFDNNVNVYYASNDKKRTALIRPYGVDFPSVLISNSSSIVDKIAQKYLPVNEKEASKTQNLNQDVKGAYNQTQNLISLFQAADQSTFAHESAHAFLTYLEQLAIKYPDSRAAKDYATIKAWAEWKDGAAAEYAGTASAGEFAKREAEIKEALKNGFVEREIEVDGQKQTIRLTADELKAEWVQERFARGFEEYLRNGEAPTSTLKQTFRKFKRWLGEIYRQVTGAGVRATPEVEAIMARMIASEEEIEAYNLMKRAKRIQDVDADLLDTDTQAMLQRWEDEAKAKAEETLLAELIKEYEAGDLKQHMADYEKQLEQVMADMDIFKAEAVAKAQGEQAVVTLGFYPSVEDYRDDLSVHNGGFDGFIKAELQAEADRYKTRMPSPEQLRQMAEEAVQSGVHQTRLAALEAEILGRRIEKYANAPKKLSLAMDDVEAALQGEAEPLKKAILALKYAFQWEAKQAEKIAMLQDLVEELKQSNKEGQKDIRDRMTAQVAELKKETMQNKAWLRGVRDAAKGKVAAYRAAAKQKLAEMTVAEATNTRAWSREAEKAAQECLKLVTKAAQEKDAAKREALYKEAQQAKIRQAVYSAMVSESLKIKKRVDVVSRHLKKRGTAVVKNKKVDAKHKYFINHALYLFGVKNTDAIAPINVGKLQDLLLKLENEGLISSASPGIISDASATLPVKKLKDMTLEEIEDLKDLIDFLYVTGVNANRLFSTDETVAEIVSKLMQAHRENVAEPDSLDKNGRKVDTGMNRYMAFLMKPEMMLQVMDGASTENVFVKYIYGPLFAGMDAKRELKEKSAEELKAIVEAWLPYEERGKLTEEIDFLPDGEALTKENIIAMALNWGNEANRSRLVAGITFQLRGKRAYTEADVLALFKKHMTENDWKFVQAIWDYIGQYGDMVDQVVQDCTGNPMKRVEASAFNVQTADGANIHVKGGYYPIKRDPSRSAREQELQANQPAAGGARMGQGMGSTKNRAASEPNKGPLLLSLNVLHDHVDQQIHIITMRKPSLDAYRLLRQQPVADMLENTLGADIPRKLEQWVEDVWAEPLGDNDVITSWMEQRRALTVKAIMAGRVSIGLLNFANFVPMCDKLGTVNAISAMAFFMANPRQIRQFVMQDSSYMRDRAENMDRDLKTQQHNLMGGTKLTKVEQYIDKYANWFTVETDLLTGVPTYNWVYRNEYNKAIKAGESEEKAKSQAHFAATEAVRNILGSADSIDQAEIQRKKSLFIKSITPFFSFFNAQMNAVWVKYYEGKYAGKMIEVKDANGEASYVPVREAFVKRYAHFVESYLFRFILMAGLETVIRTGIDAVTASHDDKPDKEDWYKKLLKQWALNSLDSQVGGFPIINAAMGTIARNVMGEKSFQSRGVADAAVERVLKPFVDISKGIGKGKGIDELELLRDLSKGIGGSMYGVPDTLTDAFWNTVRFTTDKYHFGNPDDLREYVGRTLLDKRLKPKE